MTNDETCLVRSFGHSTFVIDSVIRISSFVIVSEPVTTMRTGMGMAPTSLPRPASPSCPCPASHAGAHPASPTRPHPRAHRTRHAPPVPAVTASATDLSTRPRRRRSRVRGQDRSLDHLRLPGQAGPRLPILALQPVGPTCRNRTPSPRHNPDSTGRPVPDRQRASDASLLRRLESATERIKRLEAENQQLREALALALK